MQDFYEVKVGDRLWVSMNHYEGWGTVIEINSHSHFPVRITLDELIKAESFTLHGQSCYPSGPQCLFYGEPQIIAPERPKRTKKVQVEVRPIQLGERIVLTVGFGDASDQTKFCGPVQFVEVEVDE